MNIIRTLIIGMLFLSLFAGVPIMGGWDFLFMFEFYEMPNMAVSKGDIVSVLSFSSLLVFRILLTGLLFNIQKSGYNKRLLFVPIGFLVIYSSISLFFFFLLIPFIIVWTITLFVEWRIRNYGSY